VGPGVHTRELRCGSDFFFHSNMKALKLFFINVLSFCFGFSFMSSRFSVANLNKLVRERRNKMKEDNNRVDEAPRRSCLLCGTALSRDELLTGYLVDVDFSVCPTTLLKFICPSTSCDVVNVEGVFFSQKKGIFVKFKKITFPVEMTEDKYGLSGFVRNTGKIIIWFTQRFLTSTWYDLKNTSSNYYFLRSKLEALNKGGTPLTGEILSLSIQAVSMWFGYCWAKVVLSGEETLVVKYPAAAVLSAKYLSTKRNCRRKWKKVLNCEQNFPENDDALENPAIDLQTDLLANVSRRCRICDCAHSTLILDGCCKRSYTQCLRLHCSLLESEHCDLHVVFGCTKRPLQKKNYCAQHEVENEMCNLHWDSDLAKLCVTPANLITDAKTIVKAVNGEHVIEVMYKNKDGYWLALSETCIKSIQQYERQVHLQGAKRVRDRDNAEESTCLNKYSSKNRTSGGSFVAVGPCGLVDYWSEVYGNESLTQTAIFVSDLCAVSDSVKTLIYDFGCGLSNFFERLARGSCPMYRRLGSLGVYIDKFHERVHRCQLSVSGAKFSTRSERSLATLNTNACEQTFARFRRTQENVGQMARWTSQLFQLVSIILDNEERVCQHKHGKTKARRNGSVYVTEKILKKKKRPK
jgi:hypothetical protein